MATVVSQKLYNSIKNSPKGVAPAGIQVVSAIAKGVKGAVKQVTKKEEYVSQKKENFGNTYTKYGGVVSILKKGATPASRAQALQQKNAKGK